MERIPRRHHDLGHPPAGGAQRASGGTLSVEITPERLDSATGIQLLAELDEDLHCRYGGGDPVHAPPGNFVPPDGLFLVAIVDGVPAACGGFRRLNADTAELKRMYVRREARSQGLARRLLRELEDAAARAGYRSLWLETGMSQPEAMRLYESSGYTRIPTFGQYAGSPGQRCYGKSLEASDSSRAPLS